jgi:hypothetical protein
MSTVTLPWFGGLNFPGFGEHLNRIRWKFEAEMSNAEIGTEEVL